MVRLVVIARKTTMRASQSSPARLEGPSEPKFQSQTVIDVDEVSCTLSHHPHKG